MCAGDVRYDGFVDVGTLEVGRRFVELNSRSGLLNGVPYRGLLIKGSVDWTMPSCIS